MTEGIVQKVFNDYTVPNVRLFNYTNHEVRIIIKRIQEELIEEIKKYPKYGSDVITKEYLIGDNE